MIRYLLAFLLINTHLEAAPFTFSYGGQLSDTKGPIAGPVKIELKFYRASTGGDAIPVSPCIFENVPLQDGVFSIDVSQLTAEELSTVFNGIDQTYVEVIDRTNNVTYPRQKAGAVPFALKVPVDGSSVTYNAAGQLTVSSIPSSAISGLGNSAGLNTGTSAGNLVKLDSNAKLPAIDGSQITNISASNITSSVSVSNGGTGSTSLTANSVLLGNNTSALQTVAPGTSGNILTSNGTTWTSTAPAATAWATPGTIGATSPNTGAFTTLTTTGNVGIGTTNPTSTLDINGSVSQKVVDAGSSTSIDFSTGNYQFTSSDCSSFTLSGMNKGVYTLVVKGINQGTCSFTHSGRVFRSINTLVSYTGFHSIFTFLDTGSDVYISASFGY